MTRSPGTRGRRGEERSATAERPSARARRGGERQTERPGERAAESGVERAPARSRRRRRPARQVSPVQYRRRRLAALLFGLLLVVGLGLGTRVLLYDTGLFDVEGVRVAGLLTIPENDVRTAAAVPLGGPLVGVDTAGVADRVSRLPAVASVQVGRSWPHVVTVTVTERVPVATVTTPRGAALVDGGGVVYPGVPTPGLPRLTTPPTSGDPATVAAVGVLAALPDTLRARVRTADARVAAPGAEPQVTLELTDGDQVRWGDSDRTAEKANVLTALLTEHGTVFDVSSPDLPTIRR